MDAERQPEERAAAPTVDVHRPDAAIVDRERDGDARRAGRDGSERDRPVDAVRAVRREQQVDEDGERGTHVAIVLRIRTKYQTAPSDAERKLRAVSEATAREACLRALTETVEGRSPLIEPAQHGIGAAELVEIATAVRLELRSTVHVAWSDGAIRYVTPRV